MLQRSHQARKMPKKFKTKLKNCHCGINRILRFWELFASCQHYDRSTRVARNETAVVNLTNNNIKNQLIYMISCVSFLAIVKLFSFANSTRCRLLSWLLGVHFSRNLLVDLFTWQKTSSTAQQLSYHSPFNSTSAREVPIAQTSNPRRSGSAFFRENGTGKHDQPYILIFRQTRCTLY